MIGDEHRLTAGYIHQHVPPQSRLDARIAVLDIAQDFLLAHLHERGVFDEYVVFKGGTALRKLFAGAAGRFSTDVDLAARTVATDRATAAAIIAGECNVTLGPFAFQASLRRDRWQVSVASEFGNPEQTIKLDVGPPCWLAPEIRAFVPHRTHTRYGMIMPNLPCMQLEEIIAEKVARLTRVATARDASDLVWASSTSPHSQYDHARVRRIAVLKVWVDRLGLEPCWTVANAGAAFDPGRWLSPRDQWDDEEIGLLAHAAPPIRELEAELHRRHQWLRDLDADEARWAEASSRDRRQVIEAIRTLPGGALSAAGLR